jgi:hypothetical protein
MRQKGMPFVRPTDSCEDWKTSKQTNADRIRSMTDEKLARWMWAVQSGIDHEDIVSTYGWLDWLKQEATE